MKFLHKRMFIQAGQKVKVTLSKPANVKLMNDRNFNNYRNERSHEYFYGKLMNNSVIIPVNSSGIWNITVDLGVVRGTIRHAIEII